jgi:ABC-type dipeptide/oligopeptide/nickel transport system permease component
MLAFLLRRLTFILVVSIFIVFFSFFGVYLMGSRDPDVPPPSVSQAFTSAKDDSLELLGNILHGNLGMAPTVSGDRPVIEIMRFAYKNSMGLLLISLSTAALLGILAGHIAALSRKRRREYSLLLLTMAGVSIPSFLIAVFLQQAGIFYTVTFGRRLVSMGGYGWDFQHMLLPLLVLAARPLAYITSSTYVSLTRIMEEDYIRTAFGKGLSTSRTAIVHALRNLAIPLLTSIGISFRFALSTLVLVEFIFAWPGLGQTILQAIQDRVPLLVAATALALGLTIQISFLLLDLAYQIIDPRTRETL